MSNATIKLCPISNIIDNIHEDLDEIILQCYETYGYTRDYIKENPSLFSVSISSIPGSAPLSEMTFYANNKALFAITQELTSGYTVKTIAEEDLYV